MAFYLIFACECTRGTHVTLWYLGAVSESPADQSGEQITSADQRPPAPIAGSIDGQEIGGDRPPSRECGAGLAHRIRDFCHTCLGGVTT